MEYLKIGLLKKFDMISVIVTYYNNKLYINQCIDSIINQSFNDLEIIIIDDCSTDYGLLQINTDPRIKIIRNSENFGAGKSRSIGINLAQGDYIILIDSDDYITKNYLEVLYKYAKDFNADIVSGNIIHSQKSRFNKFEIFKTSEEKILFKHKEKLSFINNKLIRRNLWTKVPYCTRRFIEDAPVYDKLLYYANKIVSLEHIEQEYYFYRVNPKSLCHTSSHDKYLLYYALYHLDNYDFFKNVDDIYFKNTCANVEYLEALLKFVTDEIYCDQYKIKEMFSEDYNDLINRKNKYEKDKESFKTI